MKGEGSRGQGGLCEGLPDRGLHTAASGGVCPGAGEVRGAGKASEKVTQDCALNQNSEVVLSSIPERKARQAGNSEIL